jgi:transposase
VAENQALKSRLSRIEEQLGQNSQNSSKSPSQDGFGKLAIGVKAKSQKQRGGQPGHAGHQPKLYELSALDGMTPHMPTVCPICGEGLTGEDPAPYRHQILEMPVLPPQITEHQLH